MLSVYNYVASTQVLGPYKRFALWTQGCDFACQHCMTPDAQSHNDGMNVQINTFVKVILEQEEIEGITITGGEPFLQSRALTRLLIQLKTKRDLGVIIYTGFTLEQLRTKKSADINALLAHVDILIDGLYVDALNDGISLRGSSNQQVHQFTDRYRECFDQYYNKKSREIEVHLETDEMMLVGVPKKRFLDEFNNLS